MEPCANLLSKCFPLGGHFGGDSASKRAAVEYLKCHAKNHDSFSAVEQEIRAYFKGLNVSEADFKVEIDEARKLWPPA
jgi:hypothetical protein